MIRVFNKLLNGQTLFPIQNAQYMERIPMSGTVPAGSGGTQFETNVSFLGHFLCAYITGNYQTLYSVTVNQVAKIVDDGICHLRGQLIDGNGQRLLFSDFVPFDLFLSPGRTRSTVAENNLLDVATYANKADNAPALFYPIDEEYLFSANSNILLNVKNDSNTPIAFNILFSGVRIKTANK
jgi:hypothetical protein